MTPISYLKLRLSVFMFLQYFIWGAWFPSMGAYLSKNLGFGGAQIGAAYSAFAIGAIISPVFVGLIADRFFASEKLLACLATVGALTLFVVSRLDEFGAFYPGLIFYCTTYVPTLALGNSLSMAHLPDIKKSFPHIKILSAVGWIAGSVTLSSLHGEQSSIQFLLAGAASLVFAGYCLTLPHTPPKKAVRASLRVALGLDALDLFKRPSLPSSSSASS
jgi:nucleoside transporter